MAYKPYVMIPWPSDIPRARGIHSTNQLDGGTLRFRLNAADTAAIERATEIAGVNSVSAFTRWVTVKAAYEIIKTLDEDANNDDSGTGAA